MTITAKELSKKLNLSEAAISMALNNKPGVSTKTRNLVLEEAKKHGYDFTRIEEAANTNSVKGIIYFIIYRKSGAIVADTPFFSQLSEGIEAGCKKECYSLSITYIYEDDDIAAQLQNIIYSGCSGIILLGTEMNESNFAPFSKQTVPIVILDSYFESIPRDCVLINNRQGAYLAASYLISKCKKQPGYLRSFYSIGNFEERTDGFFKAIRSHGMSKSKSIIHQLTPSVEGAYEDMKALLESGEEPVSCYFADNDLIAAGAMKAFREAGYRIPEDISIVGFDNQPLCNYIEPPLTTIHVPTQYMGETAARRLIQIIVDKNSSPVKIEINTSLVKRKSVLLTTQASIK
jgi:LacI family transcriptional regulator